MAPTPTYRVGDWVKTTGPGVTLDRRFTRRIGRVYDLEDGDYVVVAFDPDPSSESWDVFWSANLAPYQPSRQREAAWLIARLSK